MINLRQFKWMQYVAFLVILSLEGKINCCLKTSGIDSPSDVASYLEHRNPSKDLYETVVGEYQGERLPRRPRVCMMGV